MKNHPLVSIIMPLYNGEQFLEAAVQSVLAQSYGNWELLIVDDGSKDGGFALAKKIAETDSRIYVFQHEKGANRGVSATRNLAISKSKGEYLALLDCDDVWLDNKLEKQVPILRQYPEVGLVYSQAQVIDEEGTIIDEKHSEAERLNRKPVFGAGLAHKASNDLKLLLAIYFRVPASSALMRKSFVNMLANFKEELKYQVEDAFLFFRLLDKHSIYFIPETLIHYRVHGAQWNSGLNPVKSIKVDFYFYQKLLPELSNQNRNMVNKQFYQTILSPKVNLILSKKHFKPQLALDLIIRSLFIPKMKLNNRLHILYNFLEHAVLIFRSKKIRRR